MIKLINTQRMNQPIIIKHLSSLSLVNQPPMLANKKPSKKNSQFTINPCQPLCHGDAAARFTTTTTPGTVATVAAVTFDSARAHLFGHRLGHLSQGLAVGLSDDRDLVWQWRQCGSSPRVTVPWPNITWLGSYNWWIMARFVFLGQWLPG